MIAIDEVTQFPHRVQEIENAPIALADGTGLTARLWLPADAWTRPVPAILEFLPYRKRDGTRERDHLTHPYYAGNGYACVRVDMRGSGESDGILEGEYLPREQDDALEVLAWIAAQPWCSGQVGMIGISWGGFNGLQVAARRPPQLKAVVTIASTDDRYADDIHYMGGVMINDSMSWAATMFAMNTRPPDPALTGDWRRLWLARLEANHPWLIGWLRHQRRDAFWKHGSVCEDYGAIEAAVYAVGGWADGYSNAVPRMLAGLSCPRKGLVGPWGHKYPHDAIPGPSIGFLQHALQWWDRWLKDEETGIMAQPAYRVWLEEPQRPAASLAQSRGRWVEEAAWPSPNVATRLFHLNADGLGEAPRPGGVLVHRSPETVGQAGGVWCPYGLGGTSPDLAIDQRGDDAGSLTFDSEPLAERLEILGAPAVRLALAIDKPQGMVAVRLNDVAPDGTSWRVSYGLLNLSHRHGHEQVAAMVPGREEEIVVRLNDCAHAFPAGHRIRIAISTSYFPVAWPAPEAFHIHLRAGGGQLELPQRAARREDARVAAFPPPQKAFVPEEATVLVPGRESRHIEHDVASGAWVTRLLEDAGSWRLEAIDLECADGGDAEFRIVEGDPCSARGRWRWWSRRRRGDWAVEVKAQMTVSVSKEAFHIASDLEAFEGGGASGAAPASGQRPTCVFARSWNHDVPRDHL